MLMNCGDSVLPRPSVGAWVLYGMGAENENLPGFIAMCPGGYPVTSPMLDVPAQFPPYTGPRPNRDAWPPRRVVRYFSVERRVMGL